MSPQKDGMITRQAPEQHIENENNQWILESLTMTLGMGSPNASITTNMGI